MRKNIIHTILTMTALLASSVAHAAPGQTTGNVYVTSTWGPREGNSNASIDLTFNSYGGYTHNASSQSSLGALAWSQPSATLLGHKETFWNVSTSATTVRALSGGNATTTGAGATLQLGGTTYYTCSLTQSATSTTCAAVRSLNKTFAEGKVSVPIVAGLISLSVGARINGNVSASVSSAGRLSSLSNAPATSHDEATAGVTANGTVSGTAWAFVGILGIVGAGCSAKVDFLHATATGPRAMAQRNKCQVGANCTYNNRAAYRLDTHAGGTSFDTLSGKINVEGCVGYCASKTIFSWKGIHLGDFDGAPNYSADSFASGY